MTFTETCSARAGLIGNPADQLPNSKVMAFTFGNFQAEVTLRPSDHIEIIPGERDCLTFNSLRDLARVSRRYGYYGGARLFKAAMVEFFDYCQRQGIALPKKGFTVSYRTSIPLSVGLAGSSAIVTAFFKSLLRFYDVAIPPGILANLILATEKTQLGISAGLMDRVAQVYGGLIYMNFGGDYMAQHGYGLYEPLDTSLLPPLFIAYSPKAAEESGRTHGGVMRQAAQGDRKITETLKRIVSRVDPFREALLKGDVDEMGRLMDANFDDRASIYNLSPINHQLIKTARNLGWCAKFAGSGGAVVGIFDGQEKSFKELTNHYQRVGAQVIRPDV